MALPKQHSAHRLGAASAPSVLEFYWDFTCPFSARSFEVVRRELAPWLEAEHPSRVCILFRHQVQPWHPQGILLHEAALAVERVDEDKFWPFCEALFAAQEQFYDEPTENKTRRQIYEELAEIAQSVGVSSEQVLRQLSLVSGGTHVTPALKYFIKVTRQNGVHVSPSVVVDGLVDPAPSSSWSLEQWKEHLQGRLLP
eukprot:TRINITY_DN1702_c0_g1_i2.p1 TRINITY_DN1702_c0_g1~~TRINITY_DN1702_c0_g1_i2.p1  ORF type:complete len:198 (-),score=71.24 TRINITY_DN1702_c0_g1_i2:323-916(-)